MDIFKTDGTRDIDVTLRKSDCLKLRKIWKESIKSFNDYPNKFNNKGIVMCFGKIDYYTCGTICIKILRDTGCKLPIEVHYLNGELNDECIKELEIYDVSFVNIESYYLEEDFEGYMLKPLSIINSSFEEVLFIDSDNICLRDPTFLFDNEDYKKTGCIFWPDFWKTAKDNPVWDIMNVKYSFSNEQESGQLLVHKRKCWNPLLLCLFLNKNSKIYYRLLLGDKDTFRFAWLALNKTFFMISTEPGICGYMFNGFFRGHTIVQYDNNDLPLFLHRNLLKWDITKCNEFTWKIIKRFLKDALRKEYYIGYCKDNGHNYVNLEGDIKVSEFNNINNNEIETKCHNYLNELRAKKLYSRLLLQNYIQYKRGF